MFAGSAAVEESGSMGSEIIAAGVAITEDDVCREAQYHPAPTWEVACHEATRALVIRELLLVEAKRRGLLETRSCSEREIQAAIEQVTQRLVPVPEVSDEACREYYEENPGRFVGPLLLDPSHILIAANQGAETREETRARAEELLRAVQERPQSFEHVAREHSACPSASNGGRLGQVCLGETATEFEAALLRMEPGELHPGLVETQHGFHLVRLNDRAEGRALPFHSVSSKIRLYLRDQLWRRNLRECIRQLAQRHGVVGFDLESSPPEVPAASSPKERDASPPAINEVLRAPRRLPVLT